MWTVRMRKRCVRKERRYPTDLTDKEWALIEPLSLPAKHGGCNRSVDVRKLVNALLYVLETGCLWRHLPKDLQPKCTVHVCFDL